MAESESSQKINKLRLDALSVPHLRDQERAWSCCSTRQNWRTERVPYRLQRVGRDVAKELTLKKNITKEIHDRIQRDQVYRESQLKTVGTNKRAWRWTNWHKKITPTVYLKRNSRDIKDNGISPWTNRVRMHWCDFDQTSELQSRFMNPSPPRIRRRTTRTNTFSSIPKVAPVFFQFFMVELGWKTGGAQNVFFQEKFVVVGSFAYDSNLLQPTVCVNSSRHTSPFPHSQRARAMMCHTTLAQVFVRVIPSMCHASEWIVCSLFSILTLLSSLSLSSISSSWTLTSTCSSSKWMSSEQGHLCTPPNEESGPWPKTPLSQVMSPTSLTIFTTQRLLKSSSRSNPATPVPSFLLWRGTQWRDHRQSALFTTVHSGARRTSGRRQAYHSFEESLLPTQSLSVCHARTAETRAWT